MWMWILVAGAAALVVFALVFNPTESKRERPKPKAKATAIAKPTPRPSRPASPPKMFEPTRVVWPPGYRPEGRLRAERRRDYLYLVDRFPSYWAAFDFLKRVEVRQERLYVIAESPERNIGKDLVMIFDEADGAMIEYGTRDALVQPVNSATDCARCGFPVIPLDLPVPETGAEVRVFRQPNVEEMRQMGMGFQCASCGALGCAHCYEDSGRAVERYDGSLRLACWMPTCGKEMSLFFE